MRLPCGRNVEKKFLGGVVAVLTVRWLVIESLKGRRESKKKCSLSFDQNEMRLTSKSNVEKNLASVFIQISRKCLNENNKVLSIWRQIASSANASVKHCRMQQQHDINQRVQYS